MVSVNQAVQSSHGILDCVDSIPDCFVDPFDVYEAVCAAAGKLPHVDFHDRQAMEDDLVACSAMGRMVTAEQCREFVDKLARETRITRKATIGDNDLDQEYKLDFRFERGPHTPGDGGQTRWTTELKCNGQPLLASVFLVQYSTSLDDSDDFPELEEKQTYLIQSDELASAVFDILRGGSPQKPR